MTTTTIMTTMMEDEAVVGDRVPDNQTIVEVVTP